MWIFTSFGFFSVVQHRDDPRYYLVRARARVDLEALVERISPAASITRTPTADYPYRITLAKSELDHLMLEIVDSIDYPNFKSEVMKRQGRDRADTYHDVWDTVSAIEDDGARVASPPQGHRQRPPRRGRPRSSDRLPRG